MDVLKTSKASHFALNDTSISESINDSPNEDCQKILAKLSDLEFQKFSLQRKVKKEYFKKGADSVAPLKKQIATIDSEIILLNRAFTKLRIGTYYVEPKIVKIFIH